ncbi:MAG: helix-turn-helix domain-containing protein [Gemmataceae bacterium]|nr:helix-turn-helix domain-containing protein [Gemmataceae bacterium]
MLSVKEAAKRWGVSAALIYGWVESGELPHYRLGASGRRGTIRIAEADMEAFLAARKRGGSLPSPPAPRPFKHVRLPS